MLSSSLMKDHTYRHLFNKSRGSYTYHRYRHWNRFRNIATKSDRGTGLGLFISKALLKHMEVTSGLKVIPMVEVPLLHSACLERNSNTFSLVLGPIHSFNKLVLPRHAFRDSSL